MLLVRARTVLLCGLVGAGCAPGSLDPVPGAGNGDAGAVEAPHARGPVETIVGATGDAGAHGPGDNVLLDPQMGEPAPPAPLGTWYLNAEGARLTLAVTRDAATGSYAGTLDPGDGAPAGLPTAVDWNAATHRLEFHQTRSDVTVWYQTEVTDGVLTGRWAQTLDVSPPAATDYTGHVTGWDSDVIDRALVPRVWEIRWTDGRLGRLRVDRAGDGTTGFVGTLKVYGVEGSTTGEEPEYDIDPPTWDGSHLGFTVNYQGAVWQYAGTATGRTLAGTASTSGCNCTVTWSGTRAEVLGHGLTPRTSAVRDAWQARTRAALTALIMAGGPAPVASTVTVLRSNVAPIANAALAPERDDDSTRPQAYTLTEVQFDHALADPHGGPDLARRSHAFIARPGTPPPARGYPLVLAVNGHSGSAHQMMDPGSMYWYGDGYARQGYLVVAVDVSHRPLADRGGLYNDYLAGDDAAAGNGTHPAIVSAGFDTDWEEDGERVWDVMRALDYALAQPGVDTSRVLVTGLSMGGEIATLVGALDPRVNAVVPAGYSPDMGVVLLHGNHPCWRWVHGDVREYVDVSDYHALIAPRALVVETGESDGTYSNLAAPFSGDKQVLRRSRAGYGAEAQRLVHYLHQGAHTYRVGDPAPETGAPRGVTIPVIIRPDVMEPVGWQSDAMTVQRRATLFDLTQVHARF